MFATAYSIAREYTRSVIISHRQHDGECKSGMGAFVILNSEGWFLTAYHIIEGFQRLNQAKNDYRVVEQERQSIFQDKSIKESEKQKRLKQLVTPRDAVTDYSVWWGADNIDAHNFLLLPEADLAVGQLINFDPDQVSVYPTIKDPTKGMPNATSLCKLGFPFHTITPTFDQQNQTFSLPEGSVPAPFFPLEGIYTRNVVIGGAPTHQYPLLFLETSSPGIPGQSGGPTIDVNGTIWAIQSKTNSYRLGFGDNFQGDKRQKEFLQNQYHHVGLGVHAETIIGFLNEHNIGFQLSPY